MRCHRALMHWASWLCKPMGIIVLGRPSSIHTYTSSLQTQRKTTSCSLVGASSRTLEHGALPAIWSPYIRIPETRRSRWDIKKKECELFYPLKRTSTLTSPVEDHRPGYPRYAALLSAHNAYFVCRRFDWLRARLLLQKQDKLAVLEEKLKEVDFLEAAPLYLGKNRSDRNTERISLLLEIDTALADYGNASAYRISQLLRKIRPVYRENEPRTKCRSFLSKRCRESA